MGFQPVLCRTARRLIRVTAIGLLIAFAAWPVLSAHDVLLYQEDFESSTAPDWDLQGTWQVIQEAGGNWALHGSEHYFATYTGAGWSDYTLRLRVKLSQGAIHINFRMAGCIRYFIGFHQGGLYLNKTAPCGTHTQLDTATATHQLDQWYTVTIGGEGGEITVSVDGQPHLYYNDGEPVTFGTIAIESLDGAAAYIDDVNVFGAEEPFDAEWVRTGGPPGGLGYDIRYRFDNTDIWYVTDGWSGMHRSLDDGETWAPANDGIDMRTGASGDAIAVFCVAVDPHNPQIIWAGTQHTLGIYKSTDGGATWTKKVGGIADPPGGISVRGFTVHPSDSDTVYAAAEIGSTNWAGTYVGGKEFDKTMGVVWRTTNGGTTWTEIWRGNNLARYVLLSPLNPDVIYISTGIFDREAADADPVLDDPGGVGIVRSIDGGATWIELNASNGLGNLYVGSLFMHPTNPDILLAGAGNNAYREGSGVYRSIDGGASWSLVLDTGVFAVTSVELALSNPLVAYAGTESAFFRSADGGLTWAVTSGGAPHWFWGPPGIRAGFPIDFQVDSADPNRVFANNYMGGNYLSHDGGTTWEDASRGYTGAQIRGVDVSHDNHNWVYVCGRSGPFKSLDAGATWQGLAYPPITGSEWRSVGVHPGNANRILIAEEHFGFLYLSSSGGLSWTQVFDVADAHPNPVEDRGGFADIEFAPSNPSVVYAGMLYLNKTTGAVGVIKSTDGGATWTQTNDALIAGKKVRTLAIDPSNPDVVYAGTELAKVARTADGGSTWASASSGLPALGVASLAIDPRDPLILYAGLFGGAVYKTIDGGTTWTSSSFGMDPGATILSIVVDPTDSQILYAADQNAGVYRSANGGTQWLSINTGLRMRAVNALAISSGGEMLYAATEGEGVFRLDLWELNDNPTDSVFRVTVDGDIRSDQTVHAASFQTGAADVAEWVETAEPAEPGDVLELDPSRAGSYRLSTSACSMLVAGVVSTEPGVILGTDGAFETRALLALSGIVPVKVTDEGGPIEPGDLLVTASTPGCAMRWTGSDPPPCALVGKALQPMTGREGIILVLLTAH